MNLKKDVKKVKIDSEILQILIKDKTTGKNILWATSDYKKIASNEEMQIEQLELIKPRFEKFYEQQKNRTRDKAEIFTPSWTCNEQNNLIDEAWFGKSNIFNEIIDEKNHIWQSTSGKILFEGTRTWQTYVEAKRLEITCGEAPYIVSRYDTVTGKKIPIENRIGFLDRKLRVVGENIKTKSEWLEWAEKSFQSVYGYEFQGDNLFIARKNIFSTYVDYYEKIFDSLPSQKFLKNIAEIISWNLWQMDGLTNAIPYYEPFDKNFLQGTLFEAENVYCKIKDWKVQKIWEYRNLLKGS